VSEARLRFAPSPTGYLHVGGARTALFNWLFARKQGGKFLLRIEDTDQKRSTPEAVEVIFEGLRWLGLDWDEEPLFQSTRLEEHRKLVDQLLEKGAAYRCFCEPEKLEQARQAAEKKGTYFGYPGSCRNLSPEQVQQRKEAGDRFAIRFKTPEGVTTFNDLVHGLIEVNHDDVDDFIILRRNGTPVYQIAVVADDHHMGVTHVIRGDDHLTNTPKQILIYKALNLPVPEFTHVPLILGPDKKRLSKRHGATSITEYRDRGILPETMCNFLVLLGWSPGEDREIMTTQEMIDLFSPERLNASGAVFDETKLQWMNVKYISILSPAEIWERIKPYIAEYCKTEGVSIPEQNRGLELAVLFRERLHAFQDAPELMAYFLSEPVEWDEKGARKFWKEETPGQISELLEKLKDSEIWNKEHLEAVIDDTADQLGLSRSKIIHPLRLALTGRTASPGIFDVMRLLGKEVCIQRMEKAIHKIVFLK
jgi:glutamyl-tRNA synthetase